LSLLRDVTEKAVHIKTANNLESNSQSWQWCQQWQYTINSQRFIEGLKRLFLHEQDVEIVIDNNILTRVKIQPITQIFVDLFIQDESEIAADVPGTDYFDSQQNIFYILNSPNRWIMLSYLTASLNHHLSEFCLENLLPLASLIDTQPTQIHSVLDELRIGSLPTLETRNISSPPVSLPQLAKTFYQKFDYDNILEESEEVFNLSCYSKNSLEVQVLVKAVTFNSDTLCLQEQEWSFLKQTPTAELLIICFSIDNPNTASEMIQIREVWETLQKAELNTAIEFAADSNNLMINWNLIATLNHKNIKICNTFNEQLC
ncbi:MAG: hypothetical protein SWJ54_22900, partial [Cyanobacteriota bacterium]|nr:hypothetical protein [Cyanobacteriota bacterium]